MIPCPVSPAASEASASGSSGSGSRFIDTVRKALISRVRNASTDNVPQQMPKKGPSEPSPPCNRSVSKSSKRSIEPTSPLSSPDLTLRRDSDRGSPSLGSQDSSHSTTDNHDSSLATLQHDDTDSRRESANNSEKSSFQHLTHENLHKRETVCPRMTEKSETHRVVSESDDSSLNSELELDQVVYPDSDTGLESMSSAETHEVSQCPQRGDLENETLRTEVTRLKCDKLDLLRQNVVSYYSLDFSINSENMKNRNFFFSLQHTKRKKKIYLKRGIFKFENFQTCQRDIKRLREKELQLQSDLAAASTEILRLRGMLKECSTSVALENNNQQTSTV